MVISRRALLLVAASAPALAAPPDPRRAERSLGSARAKVTAIECFSLSCSHCAAFAREALPELKAKWITPGRLRWVFYDMPTDLAALHAAMVARYLPAERYERFIDALFANQQRWAFGSGDPVQALWPFAGEAGMDRATFDGALADTGLRDWIVAQSMDAQTRWHIDSTPSFVIDGKVYAGAMSAKEFAALLGN
jgi:protein-disulfide isomerase